ncbi:hypothetical protein BT69DRAFT_1277952, partial [Atractiella rhizophila]
VNKKIEGAERTLGSFSKQAATSCGKWAASQQNAATEGKRNKAPPRYRCNQEKGKED